MQVYSCSFDGAIRIWSASTGAVHQELNAHTDSVVMCDVSANEELLCSASLDGTVRVWLLSTGKLLRTFRGHRHYVKVARFTPNGEAVVSAGLDREIMCWDLHEDSIGALWVTHAAHEDHILDLICVPPDAFISCSRDQVSFFY
jgi:WD40 repeat protein